MSGRINPREYDLGELRDAAREASRRGVEPPRSDGALGSEPEPSAVLDSETSTEAEPSVEDGAVSAAEDGMVSAAEDPQAYLRSRHRRGRIPADGAGRAEPGERNVAPRSGDVDRGGGPDASGARHSRPDDPGTDIEFLSHGSEGEISRPYLEALPGGYGAQSEIFEWLDRLVTRGGREGALEALEYYESVGWLSAGSRADLEAFVDGLGTADTAGGSLGMSDHRESLSYIARLAGRRR
jgi:hypothetical protein